MHSEILSKYTLWYVIPILLLSALISWYLYRKDEKFSELENIKLYSMIAMRFLSVFFVGIFLLSVVLRSVHIEIENPIIIVAHDNSESIKFSFNGNKQLETKYTEQFNHFIQNISQEYQIGKLAFGETSSDSISYRFNEKETDFSNLFSTIEKRFVNYNVGALVIASDGIYNRGVSPVYLAKKLNYPVYTIALGDSSRKRDIFIKDVLSNSIAFLGDEFPLEVQIAAYGFKNELITLRIVHKGKILKEEKININRTDFFKKLHYSIAAEQKGLQHYKIELSYKDTEFTKSNNRKNIAIDVLDDKKKVLILANSVHPDIAAIREALKSNKNLFVDFYTIDQFKKNIEDYQLVIFHQLPSYRYAAKNLFLKLSKAKIPALFILGSQSNINSLNTLNTGLNIKKNQRITELSIAKFNNQFKLFDTEQIKNTDFNDFPPLITPFGEYMLNKKADILFYQQIKGIRTEKPLIFIVEDNSATEKFGFICGEGIWKWRMNDYRENENHQQFDALIDRMVHYLSLDIKKERFIVRAKRIFNENELIHFRADFYNKSYELTNQAEVSLEIVNEQGERFNYIFSRTNGAYELNTGQLPVGKYKYKAQVTESGKKYIKTGAFIVVLLNVEATNIQADYQMLHQLAIENGGIMFMPNQLEQLISELKQNPNIKPISFATKDLIDLIELKWLFFIIISLLSVEWFLRKYFGGY